MRVYLVSLSLFFLGACELDQVCDTDANCPSGKVCVASLCVAPTVGEGEGEGGIGEGEGDVAEGEGDVVVGEGEGEGEVAEGEGEGEFAEGEGDVVVGEGEGEGESDLLCPLNKACGNAMPDEGEECDDGTQGGAGCTAGCRQEVFRCGVEVPSDFRTEGAIVGPGVAVGGDPLCFDSMPEALAALDGTTTALFVRAAIYVSATSLPLDRRVVGAGTERVVLTTVGGSTFPAVVVKDGGTIEHLTIQGNSSKVVVLDTGGGVNDVIFQDVVIGGSTSNTDDLIFNDGGATSLAVVDSILRHGDVFFGSSSVETPIRIENTSFQKAGLSLFAASDVMITGDCFDLVQNNIVAIDPGPTKNASFFGNTVGGADCDTDQFADERPISFEDGVHQIAANHFLPRANCTAVRISDRADQPSTAELFSNRFDAVFGGQQVDLDLQVLVTLLPATNNDWSNVANPCANIRQVDGASIDLGSGMTCP
jgi:hypothetical protein